MWELWKERNARVFRNKLSPLFVIVDKIKGKLDCGLGELLPGE
jgi:hypothetical protein